MSYINKPKFKHPQLKTNELGLTRRDYEGAIGIEPTEPGADDDVTVMDYTSLYPTTVMAFNISR
ncbi:MAG: hypothetical protein MK003_06125, partial [Pseudomonadales bacterium]|nr:hypothetical protein [Pseudomonadales bacterium]